MSSTNSALGFVSRGLVSISLLIVEEGLPAHGRVEEWASQSGDGREQRRQGAATAGSSDDREQEAEHVVSPPPVSSTISSRCAVYRPL